MAYTAVMLKALDSADVSTAATICTDVECRRDFMTADKRRKLRRVREAEPETEATVSEAEELHVVDGIESVLTAATNHSVFPVV